MAGSFTMRLGPRIDSKNILGSTLPKQVNQNSSRTVLLRVSCFLASLARPREFPRRGQGKALGGHTLGAVVKVVKVDFDDVDIQGVG